MKSIMTVNVTKNAANISLYYSGVQCSLVVVWYVKNQVQDSVQWQVMDRLLEQAYEELR